MIDPQTGAPAPEEPKVVIGGATLTMRAGLLSAYEMSAANVDPMGIFAMSDQKRGIASFAHIMQLFRTVIAHNYVTQRLPVPSVEELVCAIEAEPEEKRAKLVEEISQKTLEVCYPKLWALTRTMKLRESAPAGQELPN